MQRSQTQDDAPNVTTFHVERWLAGDEAAFTVLHTRFAPLLERRVRRHAVWPSLRARIGAEDVVQEAWAKVVRFGLGGYTPQGPGSFLAYLARITDNTVVDIVRRLNAAKRGEGREHVELGPEDDSSTPHTYSPVESPTGAARRHEIEELAARLLTARECEAWELVELEDYTSDEAGLALGTSGSAIRGLLKRARTKLITHLRQPPPT